MTEEQRMREGRRMFQIFAARMFEQRVLTAYREKVARERQKRLIEEVEAEQGAASQRDAKKARDAEKKKAKKQQQKQAKAEERARKEEQKAAEEAAAREAEIKKQEEQKARREEQRKKREAERKAQEEERQRKEAEKQRRQLEERERQQEAERKAREQKAEEKRRREEARKKEREEREAKEQAVREKKAHEERVREENEAKAARAKADAEAQERKRREEEAAAFAAPNKANPSDSTKRPSLPAVVALPPGLKHQKSGTSQASPQTKVATPVVPRAPTPVRTRETSGQNSQGSASHTPETIPSSKQSSPPRTTTSQAAASQASPAPPKTQGRPPQVPQTSNPQASHAIGPPPGMHHVPNIGYPNMPPGTLNGPPRAAGHLMQGFPQGMPHAHNRQFPMHPQGPHMNYPHPLYGHPPGTMMPPGMNMPPMPPRNFGHESNFHQQAATNTPSHQHQSYATTREPGPLHSRQSSTSMEPPKHDNSSLPPNTQPISRPQPIKRPTSTKVQDSRKDKAFSLNSDIDDITKGLGSSALLDDSDDPLPAGPENRRSSAVPGMPGPNSAGLVSPLDQRPSMFGGHGRNASGGSLTSPGPFAGQHHAPSTPGWGGPLGGGWGESFGGRGSNRPGHSRHLQVRQLACRACQRLSGQQGPAEDGYHLLTDIVSQMDTMRQSGEPHIQTEELANILDTEGDGANGGGSFLVQQTLNRTKVKWERDSNGAGSRSSALPGLGLGEIGTAVWK